MAKAKETEQETAEEVKETPSAKAKETPSPKVAKKANHQLRDTILADVHPNRRKGEQAKARLKKIKEGKL